MPGPTVGREAKAYYNTGSFGTPTWTLIDRIVDLDWDMPATWADISSRWSIWKMEAKAMIGLVVNFGYRRRQGFADAVFTALRGYALAATKQELALADGAIATTTTQYVRATYQFEMGRSEPMEDGCIENFSAHLTYEEDAGTGREPSWVVV